VRRLAGALGAALLALLATGGVSASPAAAGVDGIAVTVDRTRVDTVVGGRFVLRTRLSNDGDRATGPLMAHLNVASLTSDVYVDPEDWSTQRSQWVDSLAPGEDQQLTWQLQAVNQGSFDAYVVLLPTEGPDPGTPLTVSRSVYLGVAGRQTLSASGALPVVVVVPALLGVLVVLRTRARRCRGTTT